MVRKHRKQNSTCGQCYDMPFYFHSLDRTCSLKSLTVQPSRLFMAEHGCSFNRFSQMRRKATLNKVVKDLEASERRAESPWGPGGLLAAGGARQLSRTGLTSFA